MYVASLIIYYCSIYKLKGIDTFYWGPCQTKALLTTKAMVAADTILYYPSWTSLLVYIQTPVNTRWVQLLYRRIIIFTTRTRKWPIFNAITIQWRKINNYCYVNEGVSQYSLRWCYQFIQRLQKFNISYTVDT